MDNLQKLIIYVLRKFPHGLWRTELVKALYLIDCDWFTIYGKTFTGMRYIREMKGPLDYAFYKASDSLATFAIDVQVMENFYGNKSFLYKKREEFDDELELDSEIMLIADGWEEKLRNKNLNGFLEIAYNTAPMVKAQTEEHRVFGGNGNILRGADLDMDSLKEPRKPKFTLEDLRDNLGNLDLSERGSDEEYVEVVTKEFTELAPLRDRVSKCIQ